MNNWQEEDLSVIQNLMDTICSYMIIAKELAPSTETPHLQGYLETKKRIIGYSLLKHVPDGITLEAAKGDITSQLAYLKKEDKTPLILGQPMQQGKRTDLEEIQKAIENGATMLEIAQTGFGKWVRYRESFKQYMRLIKEVKRNWMPEIYIYWGKTGTGKTSKVMKNEGVDNIWTWNGNHTFYQGYELHDVCLFDDFYGSINLAWMLKLCDRYPCIVNVKNGQCNWQPRKIYFTSNVDPRDWEGWRDEPQAKKDAFFRRVREGGRIIHFDELESNIKNWNNGDSQ